MTAFQTRNSGMKDIRCAVISAAMSAMCGLSAGAAALNEICVDFAVKAGAEPVLDGRLDDDVWNKAVVHTRFYEYFKPRPNVSALRSEMRLLYTDKALWIGLTHFEDHPEKLKVLATVRDGVSWNEDMDEIYVDPFGEAVGYTKLLVNSAGVIGDRRRIDGSVVLGEWSGDAWRAKTHVGDDRWTVELCLPYSDLQMPPDPGRSLWRLCVTRYQWTSGKFAGSVSSPGGNYNNTSGFGYLAFLLPGQRPDAEGIVKALAGKVAAPWCTEVDGDLIFDLGEGVRVARLAKVVADKRGEAEEAFGAVKVDPASPLAGEFAKLSSDWAKTRAGGAALADYRAADDALAAVRKFSWKLKLEVEFGGGK